MKVTPAVAVIPLLLMLLIWLSVRAVNSDSKRFDRAMSALNHFATVENALSRDALSVRTGMLRNYDPLVREVNELDDALARLRKNAVGNADQSAAVDRLAESVGRQEALIEQFKSDNALLQNSLAYFQLFDARLVASDQGGTLAPAVVAVAASMLRLTLDTSMNAAHEVGDRLDGLAALSAPSSEAGTVQALVAHGRLLNELLPETDRVLKALFALPIRPELTTLRTIIMAHQSAARQTGRGFRILLSATSLILLGLLAHLGLQLRARALALRRRAAFEHVLAGISMRFVDGEPQDIGEHIELALARMAGCVGADRAYFLVRGPSPQIYAWCRLGLTFEPGWPDRVLALTARFDPAAEGIIHVPDVSRLPPGENKNALAAIGLKGWACVARTGGDGVGTILGFDALLQPSRIAQSGELGLLPTALETIANAIRRQFLERERARLEMRLEQARRMETVGALASGIAHNFNNIVGAILGYAEMAEAQLASGSRPARNVEEIRRAGERARDLVDQILAFGRRRDLRRQPLHVKALIAEVTSLLLASLSSEIELIVREVPDAATVSGEPGQLQQVILNLCNNAAQAMNEAGRIELEADVHEFTRPRPLSHGDLTAGRYARIAVSDAGSGMDEAIIERIFEPFFTTRPTGNGLGLATVREIVREHGGALNVWSMPGHGSRFEIWLPCIAATTPMPRRDAPTLPLGKGETVLVVDEERERLLRDEEILAALGYEPVGFGRRGDALAACRAALERFEIVVVGRLTPTTAALELAAALHEIAPDLPILLATASADEIAADALVAAGIVEVVRRPIDTSEIAAALMRCLAGSGARDRHATVVTRFSSPEIAT